MLDKKALRTAILAASRLCPNCGTLSYSVARACTEKAARVCVEYSELKQAGQITVLVVSVEEYEALCHENPNSVTIVRDGEGAPVAVRRRGSL